MLEEAPLSSLMVGGWRLEAGGISPLPLVLYTRFLRMCFLQREPRESEQNKGEAIFSFIDLIDEVIDHYFWCIVKKGTTLSLNTRG